MKKKDDNIETIENMYIESSSEEDYINEIDMPRDFGSEPYINEVL